MWEVEYCRNSIAHTLRAKKRQRTKSRDITTIVNFLHKKTFRLLYVRENNPPHKSTPGVDLVQEESRAARLSVRLPSLITLVPRRVQHLDGVQSEAVSDVRHVFLEDGRLVER